MAHILLCEDDKAIRTIVEKHLVLHDHTVAPAQHGDQALIALEEQPVDLVITDVMMPGKGGLNILEYLQQHMPSMRVIAMSAADYRMMQNHPQVIKFFRKPFPMNEFMQVVDKAVAKT